MGFRLSSILTPELGVLAAIIGSLAVLRWLDRKRNWGLTRRSRLLLGIPWGTIVSIMFVYVVYLVIQQGYSNPHQPVIVAFRSWSYLYPVGVILSPFAHSGLSHLTGNLLGTAVLGTFAEYTWGHFPKTRGESTFSSVRTNPYARAFGLFPFGIIIVGLLTSILSWGPTIGFSGVVFAFVGFTLVRYPLGTVIALGVEDVFRLGFNAIREPVLVTEARPVFIQPWWAGVAVQGHLLGLFLGILVGALILRRRETIDPLRIWTGTVTVSILLSLWAVWWFRGNEVYVLYRGIGLGIVLGLSILVTLGLIARIADGTTVFDVPFKYIGVILIVFPILVVGFVAIPLNLSSVDTTDPVTGPEITVNGYTVFYAENITNRQTTIVNLSIVGETTQLQTSGVIVRNEKRHLWSTEVSTSRLAFAGQAQVVVGGIGWREVVSVRREGWQVANNNTVYNVWLRDSSTDWLHVFSSEAAVAEPVLAGKRVTVTPEADGFYLHVSRNNTRLGTTLIPNQNESVGIADITFVREDNRVYAGVNDTLVRIARLETYQGS